MFGLTPLVDPLGIAWRLNKYKLLPPFYHHGCECIRILLSRTSAWFTPNPNVLLLIFFLSLNAQIAHLHLLARICSPPVSSYSFFEIHICKRLKLAYTETRTQRLQLPLPDETRPNSQEYCRRSIRHTFFQRYFQEPAASHVALETMTGVQN